MEHESVKVEKTNLQDEQLWFVPIINLEGLTAKSVLFKIASYSNFHNW